MFRLIGAQTHLNEMNILLLVTAVVASPFIGLPGKNALEDGFDECKLKQLVVTVPYFISVCIQQFGPEVCYLMNELYKEKASVQ